MKIIDVKQQTQEWLDVRIGIPTASNFEKIITSAGKRSTQREKYLYRVAGEALSGRYAETYKNANMEWGNLMEDEARETYSLISENEVEQVGFCLADNGLWGCSPDGLSGNDGLVEIKCPLPSTQVERLIKGKFPTTYVQQVQGQLFVTGKKWCDFISYYPGIAPFIIRVFPDEKFQELLKAELNSFCEDLAKIVKELK